MTRVGPLNQLNFVNPLLLEEWIHKISTAAVGLSPGVCYYWVSAVVFLER